MNTHWFKRPTEHWLSGLLIEVFALLGFLLFVWVMAVVLMWVL